MESWKEKHVVSLGISTETVLNFEPARDPTLPVLSFRLAGRRRGEGNFHRRERRRRKKGLFLGPPPLLSWCGGRKGMADRWWLGCERGRGGRAPRKEKEEEEGSFRGWREGTFFFFFFSGPENVGAVAGFGPFL